MSQGRGLLYELQRRHVVRIAIACALATGVLPGRAASEGSVAAHG